MGMLRIQLWQENPPLPQLWGKLRPAPPIWVWSVHKPHPPENQPFSCEGGLLLADRLDVMVL